jgi:hypothetical protein
MTAASVCTWMAASSMACGSREAKTYHCQWYGDGRDQNPDVPE